MRTHPIDWKSTVSGKIGTVTGFLEKEETERLATELNGAYPDIDHDAVILCPPLPSLTESRPMTLLGPGETRPTRSPRQHVPVVGSAFIAAGNEVLREESWEKAVWFILALGCLSALVTSFWL